MTPTVYVFTRSGRLVDVVQYRGSAELQGFLSDIRSLMSKAVR